MPKKIFLIACEASGDLHGAHLIRELKKQEPSLLLQGLGGPKMKAAGMTSLYDMTRISALGLGDVIRLYSLYRQIFYEALAVVLHWQPDAVVFIDSPAFNLRFAKKIRKKNAGIALLYYICPQIWAWGGRRIHTVKKNIDKLFSILPFETDFYREAGLDCEYVGHPLLEEDGDQPDRAKAKQALGLDKDRTAVALLPGSRKKEVVRILPIMVKTAEIMRERKPDLLFYLGTSGNVDSSVYDKILSGSKLNCCRFSDRFFDHLAAMDFALVASGTATLQTALAGTPYFLLYKASWSTSLLGRLLIKVRFLGLVNLLVGREIIPEFIQGKAKAKTIAHEAIVLLENKNLYESIEKQFLSIREMLKGPERGASYAAAEGIMRFLAGSNAPIETPARQPAHN